MTGVEHIHSAIRCKVIANSPTDIHDQSVGEVRIQQASYFRSVFLLPLAGAQAAVARQGLELPPEIHDVTKPHNASLQGGLVPIRKDRAALDAALERQEEDA